FVPTATGRTAQRRNSVIFGAWKAHLRELEANSLLAWMPPADNDRGWRQIFGRIPSHRSSTSRLCAPHAPPLSRGQPSFHKQDHVPSIPRNFSFWGPSAQVRVD